MTDTYGLTSSTPFATYDPDSSSWKTFGDISLWGSTEFSETWPVRGMTRNGCAYRLPLPELHIGGSASSSLLKTPTAQLAINGGSQHPEKRKAGGHGPTLADEVEHLLPTPAAMNPNDGESLESWEARRVRTKARVGNGNGFGTPLAIAVQMLGDGTPPQSNDGSAPPGKLLPPPLFLMDEAEKHRLNAQFVEWMMGLPAGHVTDPNIGLTRNEQLKALGNGVVPQQARLAVSHLLKHIDLGVAA